MTNEDEGSGLAGLIDSGDGVLVDLDVDIFDVLSLDGGLLLGNCLFVLFSDLLLGDGGGLGLGLALGLLLLLAGLEAEGGIFVVVVLLVIIVLIIIISLLGGVGRLHVGLLLGELLLLLKLHALRLTIEPVEDVDRVHRVLRVIMEDEDHLLLVGLTLVHEELRGLALRGQRLHGRRLLSLHLRFAGLGLLGLLAAAERSVEVGEFLGAGHDALGHKLTG